MNSLMELNGYSSEGIAYEDERNYTLQFDRVTPTNQALSIYEDDTHAAAVGIEIVKAVALPGNIVYTIDLSSLPGATATWGFLPSAVTLTVNNGVYQLTGVNGRAFWNDVKSPTITMPKDHDTSWSYSSSLTFPSYNGETSKSWTTAITVTATNELSNATSLIYDQETPALIVGYPTVIDTLAGTYSLAIAPNNVNAIAQMSSQGSGGSSTFDAVNKTLTITGTKAQVNSHLANITYVPSLWFDQNFTMVYTLTNGGSGLVTQVSQSFIIGQTYLHISPVSSLSYNEDTQVAISSYPVISDIDATYTVVIGANVQAALNGITVAGSGGTVTWNNTLRQVTIQGTRQQVNGRLAAMTLIPGADYDQNFTLVYNFSAAGTAVTKQLNQVFQIGQVSDELTPVTGTLTYNEDYPFALTGTPKIIDTGNVWMDNNSSYTMSIGGIPANVVAGGSSTTTGGNVAWDNNNKQLKITGNSTRVNQHMDTITMVPGVDFAQNFVLYYSLLNNQSGLTTTVTQNVTIGTTNTETSNVGIDRSYTSYTPTVVYNTSPPQIVENLSYDPIYTVEVTLQSNVGYIGTDYSADLANWSYGNLTYTYTGTQSQCNATISSLIFFPHAGVTNNTTLIYKQYRSGVLQTTDSVALQGAAISGNIPGEGLYTYLAANTNATLTANLSVNYQMKHYMNNEILVTGRGGDGGITTAWSSGDPWNFISGGGGGAGGVKNQSNVTFGLNEVISITVGNATTNSSITSNSLTLTAMPGGAGASWVNSAVVPAGNGASGGGGCSVILDPNNSKSWDSVTQMSNGLAGTGVAGQGHAGHAANVGYQQAEPGSGGGVSSAPYWINSGAPLYANLSVPGGGITSSITGTAVTYGQGGYANDSRLSMANWRTGARSYGSGGHSYSDTTERTGGRAAVLIKFTRKGS